MTIRQNMTEREVWNEAVYWDSKKIWSNLMNKQTHPVPCCCPACLYVLSKKVKIKGMRKPFGMMSFFLDWLVHIAKLEYLKEKKTVKRINRYGRKGWQYKTSDYEEAPYIRTVKKVIAGLYNTEEFEDFALDFERLFDSPRLSSRHYKIKHSNFPKLIDKLSEIRQIEWIKTQPDLQKNWKRNWEDFKFAQEVSNYIHSFPKKRIDRRALLWRKFQGKTVDDLERIHDHLEKNFNIKCPEKGIRNKTTFYKVRS